MRFNELNHIRNDQNVFHMNVLFTYEHILLHLQSLYYE